MRNTLIASLVLLFAISMSASAQVFMQNQRSETIPTAPSELDEVYTDSLYYHDNNPWLHLNGGSGYSEGSRFTPPADFVIQGIRFGACGTGGGPVESVPTVNLSVYQNNNGVPGTMIENIWNAAPTSVTNSEWVELVLDEEDYFTMTAGTDYWFVFNNIPGTPTWTLEADDGASPGNRSKYGNNAGALTSNVPGDWVINLCGEYLNPYYDLSVIALSNSTSLFQMGVDSVLTFQTYIRNTGVTASPAGTATFTVTDSEGTEVFTNTVAFDAVAAGSADTIMVATDQTWTTADPDRYMASVTVAGDDNESELGNNTYLLLQQVSEVGDWTIYDDGTFESAITGQTGNGYGVPFYPISYPAMIDSVSFYFDADAEDQDLRVITFTSEGFNTAWQLTTDVSAGWNTFEVNDPDLPNGINIADGFFVGSYFYSGEAFPIDTDPPNSAANPDMNYASYGVDDTDLYLSTSGNWAIRGKVVAGTAPASPELVFPTILNFGDALVGEELVVTLDIENVGDLFGTIESITIGGSVDDQVRVISAMPFRIEAESTGEIELGWTPTEEGTMPTAGILVYHNDTAHNASPKVVPITGTASSSAVGDNPSDLPKVYSLAQNHPNPFNPTTEIRFGLPQAGNVQVTLYNVMGQKVASLLNGEMTAGFHNITVNGAHLSSGIYFYSIDVNGFHSMKKMVLMK